MHALASCRCIVTRVALSCYFGPCSFSALFKGWRPRRDQFGSVQTPSWNLRRSGDDSGPAAGPQGCLGGGFQPAHTSSWLSVYYMLRVQYGAGLAASGRCFVRPPLLALLAGWAASRAGRLPAGPIVQLLLVRIARDVWAPRLNAPFVLAFLSWQRHDMQ